MLRSFRLPGIALGTFGCIQRCIDAQVGLLAGQDGVCARRERYLVYLEGKKNPADAFTKYLKYGEWSVYIEYAQNFPVTKRE